MRVHVTAEVQGVRPIALPISERLIEGVFQPRDMIDVLMVDGELTFQKGKPSSKDRVGAL